MLEGYLRWDPSKQVLQEFLVELFSCLLEYLYTGTDADNDWYSRVDQHLGQVAGVASTDHDQLNLTAFDKLGKTSLIKLVHHRGQILALKTEVCLDSRK